MEEEEKNDSMKTKIQNTSKDNQFITQFMKVNDPKIGLGHDVNKHKPKNSRILTPNNDDLSFTRSLIKSQINPDTSSSDDNNDLTEDLDEDDGFGDLLKLTLKDAINRMNNK